MRIRVNGEEHVVEAPCTVEALLSRLETGGGACAVEVNAEVVPRREHADFALHDGDAVEIVTLVGGG